jgi:O-antigen/teichoic acid export membrane protein
MIGADAEQDALDARRLPHAAGWRFGYLLIQGGSSVLLFVLLGHVLPNAAFTQVAVAQGVLVLCQAVGDFGLSQGAATVLTARIAVEAELREPLVAGAATTFVFGAVGAAVLTLLSALLLPGHAAAATAAMAPAAAATVLVAGADGILRSAGNFGRPFRYMAASRFGAFAGLAAAPFTDRAVVVAVAISLGTLVGSGPAVRTVVAWTRGTRREHVRWFALTTLPLGLSSLLVVAGARLNTLILGSVSTVREAAAFEAVWRLYQIGQYTGGVLATAAAPFTAKVIAGADLRKARSLLARLLALALVGGLSVGAGLMLLRSPLAHAFYPADPQRLRGLLPPLAIASPLGIIGQLVAVALSATARGRRAIPVAFLLGAVANVVLIVAGARSHGASAAVQGATTSVILLNVVMLVRCLTMPPLSGSLRPGQPVGT